MLENRPQFDRSHEKTEMIHAPGHSLLEMPKVSQRRAHTAFTALFLFLATGPAGAETVQAGLSHQGRLWIAEDPCARGDVHSGSLTAERGRIVEAVRRLAPAYHLDPALVTAVIAAESGFAVGAVSPKRAMGLMQLTPETATRFGVVNPFDPIENLRGGMSYLRDLLQRFNGNIALGLAAYNAGEGAVLQHGGIPPYRETQNYVSMVGHSIGAQRFLAAPTARFCRLPLVYRPAAIDAAAVAATQRTSPRPAIERTRSGVTIYRGSGTTRPPR